MSYKISIRYYDREKRVLMTERVYGHHFLYWLYTVSSGRFAGELLFRQKWFSQFYGWLHRWRWSQRKVRFFVKKMNVNMEDSVLKLKDFKSFNDFFTREIDLSQRPIHQGPCVCIAPVDGKILAYSLIDPDRTFRIKRSWFNLRQFLRNEELAGQFAWGSMVISRVCLTDFHHFHFPDSGMPGEANPIKGKYHAGGPYALRRLIPFYTENYRMLTLFESDHFGQMGLVEIGALTVGSIQQRYSPGIHVTKGARKGFFELGGSTVVLLFRKGAIELDEDLLTSTRNDIETYVRFGDSIGKRSGGRIGRRRIAG